MAWLEMSRNPEVRPSGWRVGQCLWSPRRNEIGHTWGFWETMRDVQTQDTVFHLCGKHGKAAFTGFSTASSPCLSLDEGPSGPAELYRVDLINYESLPTPIPLEKVFAENDQLLRKYFYKNKDAKLSKERIFYVIQSGRLQCLNGAYLSFLSDELLSILLNIEFKATTSKAIAVAKSTATGVTLTSAAGRVGQQGFSRNVKKNYGNQCCYPECGATDQRFLVGAHIARWANSPKLRGETSNGLCLCLFHDKAFEIGAFTLSSELKVVLRPAELADSWLMRQLRPSEGKRLAETNHPPAIEALSHHWKSHGFNL